MHKEGVCVVNTEWKEIKGWNGHYEVSNTGEVRSWYYGVKKLDVPRIRKQKTDKYGYKAICLKSQGVKKFYTIHRLVAQAFIPNPNGYNHVNHKDGDKTNNAVWNLEWCTPKQNMLHAIAHGLVSKEKLSEGQRRRYEREEEHEKSRQRMKKLYENPEYSLRNIRSHNTKEYLEKAKERRKHQAPPTLGMVMVNNGVEQHFIRKGELSKLSPEWVRGRLR